MITKTTIYAAVVYIVFLTFGYFINHSHGQETNPESIAWPRISVSYTGKVPPPSKSCREYLTICEKSCTSRGDMFRFLCLGQGFNPDSERYRCQCADDLTASQVVTKEKREEQ